MPSRKRRSGKGGGPRQGISGNPQRRAEQLALRHPVLVDEPDLSPLMLDLGTDDRRSVLNALAYSLAGGAEPSPWWDESHERILAAARALSWPSRLVDLETQTCQVVGDEFYDSLNSQVEGHLPQQWLNTLVEKTAAALRASVTSGADDWPQLWALLCGLALTTPPGDTDSQTAKLTRAHFPDIKDPYRTAHAEVGKAAKLLAGHGLVSGIGLPAEGARVAGDLLVAHDVYGSRFLLTAPFAYDGETPDHWYAWDIDSCWLLNEVGAGVFGTAQDALAEWQHAVGPAAATAALSPGTPEMAARLLDPCLRTGPMSDTLDGWEPRELIREYYRLRRRAHVLVSPAAAAAAGANRTPADGELAPVREAFLDWYAARHDDVPEDVADAVDTILSEWGPTRSPAEDRLRYTCSPHRIEKAAILIRDAYEPDYASAALRLLPEWTQWCIGQSGLTGDFAARSRAAALTAAATAVGKTTSGLVTEKDEEPFRRPE